MIKKLANLIIGILASVLTIQAQWIQVGTDIDGEAKNDWSGGSVSLSYDGSIVAIGATDNNGSANGAGHVRIYQNQDGVWIQIGADIDGESADEYSGVSVSLSSDGSIVAIGVPYTNLSNVGGQVRIYQNLNDIWTKIGTAIDGEAAEDFSGESVSLSSDGSIVAIGAPGNDANGDKSGHVHIYQNQGGIWLQIGTSIYGDVAFDEFGHTVSLSSDGSVVAIGAPYNNTNGSNSGQVRIFKNQSGIWTQIGSDIIGEAEDARLGWSVSLSSDGLVVAIGASGSSEYLRVYKNQSDVWTQIGSVFEVETKKRDGSGLAVRLNFDGSVVAIGDPSNGGNGPLSGQVRIYQNQNGTWTQIGTGINGEAPYDLSGASFSLSSDGSIVAIGAIDNDGTDFDAGHVRIYKNGMLGIKTFKQKRISIYPNPTNKKVNFEFININAQSINITDITGKIILKKTHLQSSETIDLSNFISGLYIISIQTYNEMFITKIVKE